MPDPTHGTFADVLAFANAELRSVATDRWRTSSHGGLAQGRCGLCNPGMDREVNKARSFADADRHDREQQWRMTPDERFEIAAILRERAYGKDCPDVRESELQLRAEGKQ